MRTRPRSPGVVIVAGLFVALFGGVHAQAADLVLGPDPAHLKSAADYSVGAQGKAVVVMYDGKIVFENYANGGTAETVNLLASGSKSFVGLAACAAVDDGILKLDDLACESISEWKSDAVKSKITYRQLLTLTSGLTATDRKSAIRGQAWKEIIALPMNGRPGEQFEYGANQLNAFAYGLEQKLKAKSSAQGGSETFEAYLKRRILDPIGIKLEWRFKCEDGHPQVGSGAFVTARDWAKLGEMVRMKGAYEGKVIVKEETLKQCFEGTPQNPAYGLTWWLKKPVDATIAANIPLVKHEWGAVANSDWIPSDLVAAAGALKQRLYVIPSMKLVIVRQGRTLRGFEDETFLGLVLRGSK